MTLLSFISSKLEKEGFIEINDGIYLCTKDHMKAEQKEWGDEDQSKNADFDEHDYWVISVPHLAGFDSLNTAISEIFLD